MGGRTEISRSEGLKELKREKRKRERARRVGLGK